MTTTVSRLRQTGNPSGTPIQSEPLAKLAKVSKTNGSKYIKKKHKKE